MDILASLKEFISKMEESNAEENAQAKNETEESATEGRERTQDTTEGKSVSEEEKKEEPVMTPEQIAAIVAEQTNNAVEAALKKYAQPATPPTNADAQNSLEKEMEQQLALARKQGFKLGKEGVFTKWADENLHAISEEVNPLMANKYAVK